jgi:serine/threonine protein kinase
VPLAIGTRIASYEITGTLGAGGMGEVYRARDARLHRDVALKVLPDGLASDTERLARFEREAQVLAALNHSSIAQIYGIESADGVPVLVMELVEGPTLADRIAAAPLPVEDALVMARQIAMALEAAHERGIVHRDLKPANIKLRPDGLVKVLDFGLAKGPAAPAGTAAAATVSPTLSVHATQAGIILGTAAYMSPEQARGTPVDPRADIWAFGVVLFEMIAGRRPFDGDEIPDVIASVLKSEPAWHLLPSETSAAVHRLLRRCLQKDRQQRLQHIGDARIEIEEALRETPVLERVPRPRRHRERVGWSIAMLFSAVIAAAGWWTRRAPDVPEMRVEIIAPGVQTFSLSPDGRKIVYSADTETGRQLWIRLLDEVTPQPLRSTDGGFAAFWSPDSRAIAFFTSDSLRRLDLESGESQVLASVITPAGGTWGADGTILYVPNDNSGIFRVSASGGTSSAITPNRNPGLATRLPQFLPDGRHFLFYVARGGEPPGVYVGELGSDTIRRLLPADAPARAGARHLWFVRNNTLFAQPFDSSTQQLSGRITRVADDIAVTPTAAAISVSDAGPVAYRTAVGLATPNRLTWFDRAGKRLGIVGDEGMNNPSLSPDGTRVAVQRTIGPDIDVWILELERGVSTRQTSNPGIDALPLWSPRGNWMVFSSLRNDGGGGIRRLFARNLDTGNDEEIRLPPGPGAVVACDWSFDGRFVLYKGFDQATGGSTDLWVIHMDGSGPPTAVARSLHNERDGQFSPDGKWIAFESDETGRPEIYLQPFPGPGAKVTVSIDGGTQVRWRRDGQELFYIAADNTLMSVPVRQSLLPTGIGKPVPLFRVRTAPRSAIARQQYVVTPDGQRFLIDTRDEGSAEPITLILNWKPPAEARR